MNTRKANEYYALIEYLYSLGRKTLDGITKIKGFLKSDNVLYYLFLSNGLYKYA